LKVTLVERVVGHFNTANTARSFSRLPGYCMTARYPTIGCVLSTKADNDKTDGRRSAARLTVAAAVLEVC
jgi:hypothetical protein